MKRGWVLVLLLIFSVTFSFSSANVKAQIPLVTILPESISANSSLLVKVDPQTTEKPIRVTWAVYDTGNIGLGSFPMVDGEGLCYFSNQDGNATCGPSPFFQTGETELYVYVITPTKTYNTTEQLNISSMILSTQDVNMIDNTVYMYFYGKKDWMKYSIYKENLSIYQSERALDFDIALGRYEGNITLNPGVYYFAFEANDTGTYGGALKRIEIISSDFLNIQTDKTEYWTGEKVRITGATNSNTVTGKINYPDGSEALDFSITVEGDQTFSYEFSSQSDWPEGDYEVKITHPIPRTVGFSITEFFEVTPEFISETLNKSDDFSGTISIKNLRTNGTDLSISVTGDMQDSYVSIDKTTLNPQESATLTVDIPNIQSDIDGTITISTPEGLELGIPVSITVKVEGECPPCVVSGDNVLEVDSDYVIWSQECVAGEEIFTEILLWNNGDSTLTSFEYEVEDSFTGDHRLEDLESYGYIDVSVFDFTIDSGDSEYLAISIESTDPGTYQGLIKIKSLGNEASVFVDLNCFEDRTSDLQTLNEQLLELSLTEDLLNDISADISNAENAISFANYEQAELLYQRAKTKIDMVESGGAQPAADLTWVWIVVVVIVVVIVLFWFLRMRGQGGLPKDEEMEDLEGFE